MKFLIEKDLIESDNPLKDMAEEHKKKQKGQSPFVHVRENAGDCEKENAFFNHVNGSDSCEGCGEASGVAESLNESKETIFDRLRKIRVIPAEYGRSPYSVNISEANFPHNMRFKGVDWDILSYDPNRYKFTWITQEPFNDKDYEVFADEVKWAINEIVEMYEASNPTPYFEIILEVEARDGKEYGYHSETLTFNEDKKLDDLDESLQESISYHSTKDIEDAKNIIDNGFSGSPIFLSADLYDSQGYGKYTIQVDDLDSLNLYLVPSNEIDKLSEVAQKVKEEGSYDGIKYRYSKNHPYNYEIYKVDSLNKLNRKLVESLNEEVLKENVAECAWCGKYVDEADLSDTDFGRICSLCKAELDSKKNIKDSIIYLVKLTFESGVGYIDDVNEFKQLMSEDGYELNDKEAQIMYNYYKELIDMGPEGFLDEFKDQLDFDDDFESEYGDDEDDFDECLNEEKQVCCICGKEYTGYGNNAEPVCSGRCCDECNTKVVIPERFKNINLSERFDLKKALNEIDKTTCETDFLNLYESCKLNNEDKVELANLVTKGNNKLIEEFFRKREK